MDGKLLEKLIELPRGASEHPLSNEEIVSKFMLLTDNAITKPRRQKILDAVLTLDKLPTASALLPLLAPLTGAIL